MNSEGAQQGDASRRGRGARRTRGDGQTEAQRRDVAALFGAEPPVAIEAEMGLIGAVLWVGICAGAGYAFGNIPVVKDNFELVVLGIVGVSVLPLVIEVARSLRPSR